jgi:hypothetical protein
VTVLEDRDVSVLVTLLEEERRLVGGARGQVHILRVEPGSRATTVAPSSP